MHQKVIKLKAAFSGGYFDADAHGRVLEISPKSIQMAGCDRQQTKCFKLNTDSTSPTHVETEGLACRSAPLGENLNSRLHQQALTKAPSKTAYTIIPWLPVSARGWRCNIAVASPMLGISSCSLTVSCKSDAHVHDSFKSSALVRP